MNTAAASNALPATLLQVRESAKAEGLWPALRAHQGLSGPQALQWLGEQLAMDTWSMQALHAFEPDFQAWSYADAVRSECMVGTGAAPDAEVVCVTCQPFDLALRSRVEAGLRGMPRWVLALPEDVGAFLRQAEDRFKAMDGALTSLPAATAARDAQQLSLSSIAQDASPVVRLVHSTLFDALKAGASDIHLESGPEGLSVKYRIDGLLSQVAQVPAGEPAQQVISRVKVMAELDIAEQRIPQDGRFKLALREREIDLRVSIMPGLYGEDAVVRILDRSALTGQALGLRLDHLGFDDDVLQRVRRLAREPYGMLLVTGPTGSGKTTTLYAALAEIHTGEDKIITIEDPVEYQLPGILQIPVNEKKGLGFARGLRSILRHDPDKILVGEIRDADTAQIAIQSALTGHLVFTSVHANNVFDVIGRFLHMGVDVHSFVAALNGVLAQRLLRMVCPACAVPVRPDAALLASFDLPPEPLDGHRWVHGRGCGQCRGSGYKGRRAVGELLRMNDELRELIVARAPIRAIKQAAQNQGTRLMREAALRAAQAGQTTLDEVARVTFSE
ncbi:GspE/PulE family protein [Pseudorhodoferax sp. LjRoot39]|uniref:GspE/PulE family protein n=1 Tax=Pseudorhodoferax sp. LjRoot39 TaxID=3342328 RepID=UPI003ECFD448